MISAPGLDPILPLCVAEERLPIRSHSRDVEGLGRAGRSSCHRHDAKGRFEPNPEPESPEQPCYESYYTLFQSARHQPTQVLRSWPRWTIPTGGAWRHCPRMSFCGCSSVLYLPLT